MKMFIAIIASMLTVSAHASTKELSHKQLRLVNDSNIMLVDITPCYDASRSLSEQMGRFSTNLNDRFPNLKIPKFTNVDSRSMFRDFPIGHPLSYKLRLGTIFYNQKTQKYLHFQCNPFNGTKNDIRMETFVESISTERMQKFIDDEHQKWLEQENKNSQKVSEILEL